MPPSGPSDPEDGEKGAGAPKKQRPPPAAGKQGRERDKVVLAGPIPVGQPEAARAWRNVVTSALGAATGRPEATTEWVNRAFSLNCSEATLERLQEIDKSFSTIEPRFLESLLVKCNSCSFVGEQLDGFLEAQVRRREQTPALETSVLSLLQGVWQRINPPGSAESARSRAMSHMGQMTLKGHGDLELFLQRLGKGGESAKVRSTTLPWSLWLRDKPTCSLRRRWQPMTAQ